MPATERTTLPWMTTPRSSTRFTRSLSASRSSSRSKSSSADIASLAHEVIGWPGPGELEPETVRLPLPDEAGHHALERLRRIAPDEERRVHHRCARRALDAGATAIASREGVARGLDRHGGESGECVGRDALADALELLLPLRLELAREEVPLP